MKYRAFAAQCVHMHVRGWERENGVGWLEEKSRESLLCERKLYCNLRTRLIIYQFLLIQIFTRWAG